MIYVIKLKGGMVMRVTVNFQGNMQFQGLAHPGHKVTMDAAETVGGQDQGPKPSEMLLFALGGCTGMDVVSLLKKFGTEYKKLSIELEGEQAPEHPRAIRKISVKYKFKGENLDPEKARLAVEKSLGKYSVVRHSLVADVEYTIEINGEEIK